MGTVTVSGNDFTVYGTLADAKIYWLVGLGTARTKWDAADDADKSSAMVSATRLLDRQRYVATASTQALRLAIDAFSTACFELAAALLVDSSLMTKSTSGSNLKRIKSAGGDEAEFFLPTTSETGRFPTNVQELISDYLDEGNNTDTYSGSYAGGTDATPSDSGDPDTYGINRGQ